MNVGGVPFKDHAAGFWVVVGIVVVLVAGGAIAAFKRLAP